MNLKRNPTVDQLKDLIHRCDDSAGHHVLWVRKCGDVELTRIPGDQTLGAFEKAHKDMQIRFETFQAGNEYVGPDAAEDRDWVAELFDSLIAKWHQANGKAEVVYVDAF